MSKLTAHTRLHLGADGALLVALFVRCPTDRGWASLEQCRRCPEATAIDAAGGPTVVECSSDVANDRDPARTPIAEAMDPEALTVTADVTAADVARAMESRGLTVAIVVDESAHPIGVCSRLDLARARGTGRIDHAMTPFVITLLSSASVADAVDLILSRDLHHIPVLSDGRIVGVVSAKAALRWFAQNVQASRSGRAGDGGAE